jgi:DNA-binding SARP family transcriptional activator/predicted ATPase
MGGELKIYTLGGLRIQLGDVPIDNLGTRKSGALLVYLASTRHPQAREVLSELLWEDRPQQQSLANLRVALSGLNKQLDGYLDVSRDYLALKPDAGVWYDAGELEKILAELSGDQGLNNPVDIEYLQYLIENFQGEFLEGFNIRAARGFEAWVVQERERLHRLVCQALRILAEYDLDQEDYPSGLACTARLLALDPLDEEGHRLQMLLLVQSGQRSQALAQYELCRTVLWEELGIRPTEATQALYDQIKNGSLEPAPRIPAKGKLPEFHLPQQNSRLIGRDIEIESLLDLLSRPDLRLVTIVGLGGIGKTRLALSLAERIVREQDQEKPKVLFSDGVVFVPLAEVRSPENILYAVAKEVGYQVNSNDPRTPQKQVWDFLNIRELLLILDNFEHLQEGAEQVLAYLEHAPRIKILVTSREDLPIQDGQIFPLRGLAYPGEKALAASDNQAIAAYSAMLLFVERVRAFEPGYTPDEKEWQEIRHICELVEGMPLALELAAAWMHVLSPAGITLEIERNLEILATDYVGIPPRHQRMQAVLDATWERISARERQVLEGFCVFEGGFSRQAAEDVTGASLSILSSLSRSMLVNYQRRTERYHVHELVRQFGQQRLKQVPATYAQIRDKHCEYYCSLAEQLLPEIKGASFAGTLDVLEVDFENLALAWEWAGQQGQIERINRMYEPMLMTVRGLGRQETGEKLFRLVYNQLAGRNETEALLARVRVATNLAHILPIQRYDDALAILTWCSTTLDNLSESGLDVRRERCLVALRMAGNQNDFDQTLPYYDEAIELAQAVGDLWLEASTLHAASETTMYAGGGSDKAIQYCERCLQIANDLGSQLLTIRAVSNLQRFYYVMEQFDKAEEYALRCRQIAREIEDIDQQAWCLLNLAHIAYVLGQFEKTCAYLKEAIALLEPNNIPVSLYYANLGQFELDLGEYEAALEHAIHAFEIVKHEDLHPVLQEVPYMILGRVYLGRGELPQARTTLEQALKMCLQVHDRGHLAEVYTSLGICYALQGELKLATQAAIDALECNYRYQSAWIVADDLPAAAVVFALSGNAALAVEVYAAACNYGFVANSYWLNEAIGQQIAAAANQLPEEVVKEAERRGRELDLLASVPGLFEDLNCLFSIEQPQTKESI